MATEMVTTCDNCGTKKGDGNHWFRVFPDGYKEFAIFPWRCKGASDKDQKHACSDACVIQFTQQWLSAQKAQSEVLCEKS